MLAYVIGKVLGYTLMVAIAYLIGKTIIRLSKAVCK